MRTGVMTENAKASTAQYDTPIEALLTASCTRALLYEEAKNSTSQLQGLATLGRAL